MKIAVTGASGVIGRALCTRLTEAHHTVVALVRSPGRGSTPSAGEVVVWEALSGPPSAEALDGCDAVVHLAGAPVAAGRWTARRKKLIRDSRVVGTRNLVEALSLCQKPPRVLVSGSAIGYYGSSGDQVLDETSPAGDGFLAEICRQWEIEAQRAAQWGVRVVLLRTGLVLSLDGGALPRILPPFQMFVGGPLGSGSQWMSWIHIRDEVESIVYALETESLQGPVNLSAPNPVTNEQFSRTLARVLGRPALFRVPSLILRILLGEMAESILLGGQRVLPAGLQQAGYSFHYSDLESSLQDLIH